MILKIKEFVDEHHKNCEYDECVFVVAQEGDQYKKYSKIDLERFGILDLKRGDSLFKRTIIEKIMEPDNGQRKIQGINSEDT